MAKVKENKKSKPEVKEIVEFTKRSGDETVTKTIEKISNGFLLTVNVSNYKKDIYKTTKKFFEKNPLEDNDSGNKDEFTENFEILEL